MYRRDALRSLLLAGLCRLAASHVDTGGAVSRVLAWRLAGEILEALDKATPEVPHWAASPGPMPSCTMPPPTT